MRHFSLHSISQKLGSRVGWCIAFGMLWQGFTLTGPGHRIVSLLDRLLKYQKRGCA